MWITNGLQNKKINKEDFDNWIELGYIKGRKIQNEEFKLKISKHNQTKWDNGSREKIIKTKSKGTFITPWGEFISPSIAIKHAECPYRNVQYLAEKCRKNKNGFYFIPKEPIS